MKRKPIAALLLAALLLFAGCSPARSGGTFYVQFDMQQDNLYIDGDPLPDGEFAALSSEIRGRIAALEEEFSTDLAGSDLMRVNAAASGEAVSVSADTLEAFSLAAQFSEVTGGAFSPALFPLTELWGFSPEYEGYYNDARPDPAESDVAAALAVSDLSLFSADADAITITKGADGAKLDFGGIAKGYMSDEALAILRAKYAGRQVDAIFSVMSNHILLGSRLLEDGTRRGYTASVTNPRYDPEEPAAACLYIVGLSDAALTTSADNYRFYIGENGRLYPHIIDGSTGEPADNGIVSITIVMPLSVPHAGALSDALSTAGFCMPLTEALAFYGDMSEAYGASAVVITADFQYYVVGDAQVLGRKAYAQYANDHFGANNNTDTVREVFTKADAGTASDKVIPCAEELAYRERMAGR